MQFMLSCFRRIGADIIIVLLTKIHMYSCVTMSFPTLFTDSLIDKKLQMASCPCSLHLESSLFLCDFSVCLPLFHGVVVTVIRWQREELGAQGRWAKRQFGYSQFRFS